MTVNPVDIQISAMSKHLWMRYDLGPTRCNGLGGYHDCSGLAAYGMNAARRALGLPELPCWQCDTFQFEAYGHAHGLLVPVDEAIRTRGMWLLWNTNGHGHMGTSLGNGQSMEARSHAIDLGIFSAYNRGWEWGMIPIGFTRSMFGLPSGSPPVIMPPKAHQIKEDNMILCQWKTSTIPGRVPHALLDPAGKCVWLKNGASIWGDQPDAQDKNTRKWKISVAPKTPQGVPVGNVLDMAPYFLPGNHDAQHVDGVCVSTSDGGTFIGLFTGPGQNF